MAAPVAKQVSLELAETSQPDLQRQVMGKSLSSQPVDLEQEQVPPNNSGKAKKPLLVLCDFSSTEHLRVAHFARRNSAVGRGAGELNTTSHIDSAE